MAAESVLPDFEEQSSHELGDLALTIKERYLAEESCIDSEYIFERDARPSHVLPENGSTQWPRSADVRERRILYSRPLRLVEVQPYKLGSQELFIVSEARP